MPEAVGLWNENTLKNRKIPLIKEFFTGFFRIKVRQEKISKSSDEYLQRCQFQTEWSLTNVVSNEYLTKEAQKGILYSWIYKNQQQRLNMHIVESTIITYHTYIE